MAKLSTPTLLLLVLAGCLTGKVEYADLTVNWAIKNVDGSSVGCGTYTGMKVHVMTYSDTLGANEEERAQLFECSAGTGTWSLPLSGEIPADDEYGFPATDINGHYDVWVEQTESTGKVTRQKSMPEYFVDLTTGAKTVSLTLYEDGGYVPIAWNFVAASNSSLDLDDCASAGVDTIKVTAVPVAGGPPAATAMFPCEHQDGHLAFSAFPTTWSNVGAGVPPVLAAGEYDFTLVAYQNGVEVGASEPTFPETVTPLTSGIDDVYSAYAIVIKTR